MTSLIPDRAVLEGLLDRVRAWEPGEDDFFAMRDLDLALHRAVVGPHDLPTEPMARANALLDLRHYTASLDAAVALVERVLPGAVWHIMTDYGGLRRAKVGPPGRPSASVYDCEDRPLFTQADAETPSLALCAALLTALLAQTTP